MDRPLYHVVDDQVAQIVLNRPRKLNAINQAMLVALEQVLADVESTRTIRVVWIRGAGEKAFSVGADIGEWAGLKPMEMWKDYIRLGQRVFDRLARLPQPTIALLDGYALGGGLELALAADMRLASESARMALPEASVGTIPGWGGPKRLADIIGPPRARQMLFTAMQVDAQQAASWGLVNEVVPGDSLLDRAAELSRAIVENGPIAVQVAKQLLLGASGEELTLILASLASGLLAQTSDVREGTDAFLSKRPPDFQGK